jgi:alpha-mannosidase
MVKYEIDENFLNILLKGLDDTPTFEQDTTKGEGTPSEDEVAYVKSLNDLLKVAYQEVTQIDATATVNTKISKIDSIIKEYTNSAIKASKQHLTDIFLKYQDKANQRAEQLGLPTSNDRTILDDKLIPYQNFAIQKNATILREKLVDLVYRLDYFGSTYGKM